MAYRVLVDENLDPSTAEHLRDRGHEAVTVVDALEKGVDDPSIRKYAATHGYLLLTNDADFLRPGRRRSIRVLYVPENTMRAHEIVELIDNLSTYVPAQTDLPEVTWLTDVEGV